MFEHGQEIQHFSNNAWYTAKYLAPCTVYKGEHFIQTPTTGTVFRVTENEIRKKKVKKEGWVNIYPYAGNRITSKIYDTQKGAEEAAGYDTIATVRIEWEE